MEIRFDELLPRHTAHFLLMGNGVFTCSSNWPVQISLSRAKLIKNVSIISFCIPRIWRQKNHFEGSPGPSDTAGPGVAYPLYPITPPLSTALFMSESISGDPGDPRSVPTGSMKKMFPRNRKSHKSTRVPTGGPYPHNCYNGDAHLYDIVAPRKVYSE